MLLCTDQLEAVAFQVVVEPEVGRAEPLCVGYKPMAAITQKATIGQRDNPSPSKWLAKCRPCSDRQGKALQF